MQLAGAKCVICRQNVLLDGEATWCADCRSIFQGECLANAAPICPSCRRAYDPPDRHFVFSKSCPECSQATDPPQPHCANCGAGTRWDTQEDYAAFLAHMKQTAGVQLIRGIGEIGAGAVCLLAFIAGMVTSTRFSPLVFVLAIILAADGVFCLKRAIQYNHFS